MLEIRVEVTAAFKTIILASVECRKSEPKAITKLVADVMNDFRRIHRNLFSHQTLGVKELNISDYK